MKYIKHCFLLFLVIQSLAFNSAQAGWRNQLAKVALISTSFLMNAPAYVWGTDSCYCNCDNSGATRCANQLVQASNDFRDECTQNANCNIEILGAISGLQNVTDEVKVQLINAVSLVLGSGACKLASDTCQLTISSASALGDPVFMTAMATFGLIAYQSGLLGDCVQTTLSTANTLASSCQSGVQAWKNYLNIGKSE